MITKQYLDQIFFYDAEDGELYYRATGICATQEAHRKYKRVNIGNGNGRRYAHHIIWCMIHGAWPDLNIDHHKGWDNRVGNLREANHSQNGANANWGIERGVEKHGAKWRARIRVNGNRIELGSYPTKPYAIRAYQAAADRYFGEFAEHNR